MSPQTVPRLRQPWLPQARLTQPWHELISERYLICYTSAILAMVTRNLDRELAIHRDLRVHYSAPIILPFPLPDLAE